MINWISKNKIVKLAGMIAVFSVILYFSSLLIVFKETKKVGNLYNDTESEFSKSKKFWAVKSIADANSETIQALEIFFVKKDDEVQFIKQIETVARNSSVKFNIDSIDIKDNPQDTFKEDIEVKMTIEGPWESVVSFADRLGKMPFGTLINSINLDADNSGFWSGSIDFIIFKEK